MSMFRTAVVTGVSRGFGRQSPPRSSPGALLLLSAPGRAATLEALDRREGALEEYAAKVYAEDTDGH